MRSRKEERKLGAKSGRRLLRHSRQDKRKLSSRQEQEEEEEEKEAVVTGRRRVRTKRGRDRAEIKGHSRISGAGDKRNK